LQEDILSVESISDGLGTGIIGKKVYYYPSLTSTMEIARREAKQRVVEGTVVVAGEQTEGRGRLQRFWISPEGSISVSVVLYPEAAYLSNMIMVASLAVVHSIEVVSGLKPVIKWPNDVLINDKKVCGILIESGVIKGTVNHVILGIGLNVNVDVARYPEIPENATSISNEMGERVSRLHILRQLLIEIEQLYMALPSGKTVYEEWRKKLVTLGQNVCVKSGETIYEGLAESVDIDGSLLLRTSDDSLTKILAGDVVTLRV